MDDMYDLTPYILAAELASLTGAQPESWEYEELLQVAIAVTR